MNIGNKLKTLMSTQVSKSIWDESHVLIKSTPYYDIAYIIHEMTQVPINQSVWISAYDGVCDNIQDYEYR